MRDGNGLARRKDSEGRVCSLGGNVLRDILQLDTSELGRRVVREAGDREGVRGVVAHKDRRRVVENLEGLVTGVGDSGGDLKIVDIDDGVGA